ncbi:MAG: hypothetical protein ACRCUT_11620, partial [Spirochaetota bacterium]
MTAAILAAQIAVAAFGYSSPGGSGSFPYETASAECAPYSHPENPSFIPYQKGFFCGTGGDNPYGMDSLYAFNARAGYSAGPYAGAVSFSRFGTGGYLERTADLSAGIACGALFSCGVKAHACSLTIGGDLPSRFTLYDADLSARFEPFPLMSFAAFQKNIGSFINP